MSHDQHPIILENIVFTRSVVVAIFEHANHENFGKAAAAPTNTVNITTADFETGTFEVVMRCQLNPEGSPEAPYTIDMECLCILRGDMVKLKTREEATRGVMITAHSVLYGAIREAVSWITGRQPYGTLMLGLSILKPKVEPTTE